MELVLCSTAGTCSRRNGGDRRPAAQKAPAMLSSSEIRAIRDKGVPVSSETPWILVAPQVGQSVPMEQRLGSPQPAQLQQEAVSRPSHMKVVSYSGAVSAGQSPHTTKRGAGSSPSPGHIQGSKVAKVDASAARSTGPSTSSLGSEESG